MSVALGLIVGLLAVRLLAQVGGAALHAPALQRRNYRDHVLPTAGGLLAVLAVVVVEGLRALAAMVGVGDSGGASLARVLVLAACVGFGLLGFLDDVLGTENERGFRGHGRALVTGRLTTGTVKVVVGGALGLALVGAARAGTSGGRAIGDAALVALAANLMNLFDRAPGRTIKVGIVAWIPLAILAGTDATGVALAPVVGAFIGLLGDDLRERLMLGDTGAYALGGVLGLGVVLECTPLTRTVVLAVLVAMTAAAELVSFSSVIDRVAPLRSFDRWGRRAA
ncbi:MAG TPA: hypothetical protein VN636_06660 [Acidimicrobiia bacterium]|nr:hypothetical protein [Acidimicrobiia bacterium]